MIKLSWCLGDPDNPAAVNEPFMTVYEEDIHDPEKMKEFEQFMTPIEIKKLVDMFEAN